MRGSLLFSGDYFGTLATARCLGRRGIDVALGDAGRVSRTAASKYVRSRVRVPDVLHSAQFIEWLLAEPSLRGRVLLPTSDDLAYLFARHRERLAEHFHLFVPDQPRMMRILNKKRLYETCQRVGVDCPVTWFPHSDEDVRSIGARLGIDVLIKPKTQVQFPSGQKGLEVPKGGDLLNAFNRFRARYLHCDEIVAQDADIAVPMIQAFHDEAIFGIYSVAGFTDGSGRPPLVRAACKVLQQPRRLGVGLCFQSAPVRPDLLARIGALCEELEYFGIFEIEFIRHEDSFLLIDFNPRGYGQMAFEDARGLPLPYLYYLAAVGDRARLACEWAKADAWQPQGEYAYCHRGLLRLVRIAQTITRLVGHTPEPWGAWLDRHTVSLTDAVASADDIGPQWADAFSHVSTFARHPRSFLRSLAR